MCFQEFAYQTTTGLGLLCLAVAQKRIHKHRALPRQLRYRTGLRIRDGACRGIIEAWHDLRKHPIEPGDQFCPGAEVTPQGECFQWNMGDAVFPGDQELSDLGIAKSVNRLHRVADAEQGTPVIGRPASGQRFEHPVLRARCVLHLIDQHMTQFVIEQQRRVPGLIRTAKRFSRAKRYFDIVARRPACEQSLEFGDC